MEVPAGRIVLATEPIGGELPRKQLRVTAVSRLIDSRGQDRRP